MQENTRTARQSTSSKLHAALRTGLLLGAGFLAMPSFAATHAKPEQAHGSSATATKAAASKTQAVAAKGKAGKKADGKSTKDVKPGPLADFGNETAPPDVVHVANWVSYTHNSGKKAFVLIDKKQAQMYVFDPQGKLKSHAPILLGKAIGDDSAPGIGDKPLSQIKENEKTTPAGRFLAQLGRNTHNDDIIWIDYKAAVSMHRLRKVSEQEHRAERLASPEVSDNRISYGCVNVPPAFFDSTLKPTVVKQGAYVYVLPETMTPQQKFGSFDVASRVQMADAPAARKAGS
jgi:hypothetical protein